MPTTVVIPQPIRADVDEEADPHIFAEVTEAAIIRVEWTADEVADLEVEFDGDLTEEQIAEIIYIARAQPMVIDPGVVLPPQMIPDESWIQFAQLYADRLVFRQLQGKVAVLDEIWLAEYATDEAGETIPGADSNVLRLSREDGFQMKEPNGDFDSDGSPLYDVPVNFPMRKYDEDGNRQVADFDGEIRSRNAKFDEFTLQGRAASNQRGHIGPDAELQLDQLVSNPDVQTKVSFDAQSSNWPTVTGFTELGWGHAGGMIVQARWNHDTPGKAVYARFIDPDTGYVDHSVELLPQAQLAGFTADVDGNLYTLGKFRAQDAWTIIRYSVNGTNLGYTNVAVDSASVVALGMAYGDLLLLGLGGTTPNIRRYNATNLNLIDTTPLVGFSTTKRAVGVGGGFIAYGNEWGWLTSVSNGYAVEPADGPGRGWWSRCGTMTGAGLLYNGRYAATNASGALTTYNENRVNSSTKLWSSWTKRDTATGRQTTMATPLSSTWPAKTFATITCPVPAGPNDVEIYASSVSKAREDMRQIPGMAVGKNQVTISTAPTTGNNPPATSGFLDGVGNTPAKIVSQAKYGIQNRPVLEADGLGRLRAMKTVQSGDATVSFPGTTAPVTNDVVITFAVAFEAAPAITLTLQDVAAPQQTDLSVLSKSATGFTLRARRSQNTAPVLVSWIATAITQ